MRKPNTPSLRFLSASVLYNYETGRCIAPDGPSPQVKRCKRKKGKNGLFPVGLSEIVMALAFYAPVLIVIVTRRKFLISYNLIYYKL